MFGMLLEKIMLPDVQKVTGNINKKITAIGIIKVLTDTQKLIDGPYAQFWYVIFTKYTKYELFLFFIFDKIQARAQNKK